eukprot:TRINITY_DN14292_c0_g1_i1.p1 TRINITY_DN14292_c0_g1~~TRINITY_DN14292_c0_g1_i1.p1  ORF type:complete len:326 (-),score=68.03 TRINITY_DN14292_c0_g1_i1:342-1319(-)
MTQAGAMTCKPVARDWAGSNECWLQSSHAVCGSPRDSRVDGCEAAGAVTEALRAVGANCIDSRVEPALRKILETQDYFASQMQAVLLEQESQRVQLSDLAVRLHTKADLGSVPTLAEFRDIYSALSNKADVNNVPTLAHLQGIASVVDPIAALASDILNNNVSNADRVNEIALAMDGKAAISDVFALARTEEICEELRQEINREFFAIREEASRTSNRVSDQEKTQAAIAAVGASVYKKIIGLRDEVNSMCGRITGASQTLHEGIKLENQAALQRIQAVVGAAGTILSRDMLTLRRQIGKMQDGGDVARSPHIKVPTDNDVEEVD